MKPGTKVSWTHLSMRGRTMSMSLREGAIVSVADGVATVKKKSGKTEQIAVRRLRVEGQSSEIAEFIEAVREANRS